MNINSNEISIRISLLSFLLFLLFSCNSTRVSDNGEESTIKEHSAIVEVKIDVNATSDYVPDDYIGLSFETGSVRNNNAGMKGHFFSPDNTQSLTIFKQLGIKSLRIGGGSVDMNQKTPTFEDIDSLFAFAKASNVKVIYSLRLLNGNINENITVAKYIWDNYKSYLQCFAIGNEPDWDSYHKTDPEIKDYPSFVAKWKKYADAIVAIIPEVKFIAPHTGSNYPVPGAKNTFYEGKSWTVNFALDMKDSGMVNLISQHNYVGQDANGKTPREMIDNMLSKVWVSDYYPILLKSNLQPVLDNGYQYRLAESNSFSGAVEGGSNSFATALFALDYLHWWAQHKCAGVNFHNKQWVLNAPIIMDSSNNLQVNPVGYGIKAFSLGGRGYVLPITIVNPDNFNLTAYAVLNSNNVFVTIINKEHATSSKDTEVVIDMTGNIIKAEKISLVSPDGNVSSKDATLGGTIISNNKEWQENWSHVTLADEGKCAVTVAPGSAVILKVTLKTN